MLSQKELLDLQFIDARARLIDLAAFLDRMDRHPGEGDDARLRHFRKALPILMQTEPGRARAVLEAFSDHSTGMTEKAPFQGATGAPLI